MASARSTSAIVRGDACADFAPVAPIARPAVAPPPPPSRVEAVAGAPRVSCIMPTCDRRAFVPRAIRYFLRQDLPDCELVIVDDGVDPIADCVPADPRVRYLRIAGRRTIGAKRNLACEAARGDIIAHWDDDDWYPTWRLRTQLDAFARPRTEVCGSTQEMFYDAAAERAWLYRYTGSVPALAGATLMYRKRRWREAPFADVQIGEDVRFVRTVPREAIVDLALASLCVGMIHAGNTSVKRPAAGLYWSELPARTIRELLGDDVGPPVEPDAATLVSCIMPTHDRRRFLPLALGCFAAQTHAARELLVVDDGSDPVGDLVAGVPHARYFRLPRRASIGAKRNFACAQARGSIVVHFDDDDWHGPDRLRRQIAPIVSGQADLTGLDSRFVLQLPEASFWTPGADLHRRMFVGDVHGGTLAFRRTLVDEGLKYPDADLAEDAAFLRLALARGKRLARVANQGLYVYVRHGGNAWRFQAGRYLDPAGWRAVAAPPDLPADWLARLRDAAVR